MVRSYPRSGDLKGRIFKAHLHQQTSLTAGTIADNDELAADIGHLKDQGSASS
jgi:hypothetical protein